MLPQAEDIEFIDIDGISKIQEFDKPKTLTYEEIAELLNIYKIRKRGKKWTANSVANIINDSTRNESKINSFIVIHFIFIIF